MSTKATIEFQDGWHLYEEMNDDTTWAELNCADFVADRYGVRVRLPDSLIDAIRGARPAVIPHLRKRAAAVSA